MDGLELDLVRAAQLEIGVAVLEPLQRAHDRRLGAPARIAFDRVLRGALEDRLES